MPRVEQAHTKGGDAKERMKNITPKKVVEEQIKVINHRLTDLEKGEHL